MINRTQKNIFLIGLFTIFGQANPNPKLTLELVKQSVKTCCAAIEQIQSEKISATCDEFVILLNVVGLLLCAEIEFMQLKLAAASPTKTNLPKSFKVCRDAIISAIKNNHNFSPCVEIDSVKGQRQRLLQAESIQDFAFLINESCDIVGAIGLLYNFLHIEFDKLDDQLKSNVCGALLEKIDATLIEHKTRAIEWFSDKLKVQHNPTAVKYQAPEISGFSQSPEQTALLLSQIIYSITIQCLSQIKNFGTTKSNRAAMEALAEFGKLSNELFEQELTGEEEDLLNLRAETINALVTVGREVGKYLPERATEAMS